jgi:hypothetical protein
MPPGAQARYAIILPYSLKKGTTVKISVFGIPELTPGKYNIKDPRLDQVDKITRSKKKVYLQVDLVAEDAKAEADAILVKDECRMDLVLQDLEFVETRLSKNPPEAEKALLEKIKAALEKEHLASSVGLSAEDMGMLAGGLLTAKPVTVATQEQIENKDELLCRAYAESGYISFFTTGEKDTRAWLIRKGSSAWEASGAVHSDIQQGFIRAEIISFNDFIQAGGESAAKQAGKMRLEPKEYVMQDADLTNFRFNK